MGVPAHLSFEGFRVPNLPQEVARALDEEGLAVGVVAGDQKKVADGRDPGQDLNHDVGVVVGLHVVETHQARHVLCAIQGARPGYISVQRFHLRETKRPSHSLHVVHCLVPTTLAPPAWSRECVVYYPPFLLFFPPL